MLPEKARGFRKKRASELALRFLLLLLLTAPKQPAGSFRVRSHTHGHRHHPSHKEMSVLNAGYAGTRAALFQKFVRADILKTVLEALHFASFGR